MKKSTHLLEISVHEVGDGIFCTDDKKELLKLCAKVGLFDIPQKSCSTYKNDSLYMFLSMPDVGAVALIALLLKPMEQASRVFRIIQILEAWEEAFGLEFRDDLIYPK